MATYKSNRLFDNVDIISIPEREFRVLNALDVSIHRCLQKYEAIYQIVAQNKTDMNQSLVLLTWELVDWFEITRKILGYGAGLKKNEPGFKLITSSLDNVESFRHVLQHFDSFLNRSQNNDFAPLGAVSAIHILNDNEINAFVYNAGTVRGEINMGQIQLPEKFSDPVDCVTLQIDGQNLDVSEIARKLLIYYVNLKDQVAKKYPSK